MAEPQEHRQQVGRNEQFRSEYNVRRNRVHLPPVQEHRQPVSRNEVRPEGICNVPQALEEVVGKTETLLSPDMVLSDELHHVGAVETVEQPVFVVMERNCGEYDERKENPEEN